MYRTLAIALAITSGLLTAAAPARADNFIIGLPNDYPGERSDIETLISRTFAATRPGDNLSIYNAAERERLASVSIPQDEAFDNVRLKVKTFGAELQELKPFIDGMAGSQMIPSANILLPQFLRELANTALPALPGGKAEILVVGSSRYHDDREPQFSMLDGRFPSDGHVIAEDTVSPFGTANRQGSLSGANVHVCFTDADWIDDVHRQRVERFWALHVNQLGGKLASFTHDLGACTQRFVEKVTVMPEVYELDPEQTKPEMLTIVRERGEADAPAVEGSNFMEEGAAITDEPPPRATGPAKIGIRWPCGDCDIDLYARASPDADFLYFAQQVTAEGRHNRDWLNSPDTEKQYEYIDFTAPIDLTKLEIYVHFYRGRQEGGVPGEVRLWFDGKVYEKPFHIASATGNRQARKRPDQATLGDEWVKIDITDFAQM